jgi:hypothetical protein
MSSATVAVNGVPAVAVFVVNGVVIASAMAVPAGTVMVAGAAGWRGAGWLGAG